MRVWSDELSFRCVSTKGQSLQMGAQVRVDGTRVQYKYFLIKKNQLFERLSTHLRHSSVQ